jgi:hypothetical protein
MADVKSGRDLIVELEEALFTEAELYIDVRNGRRVADLKQPTVEDAKMTIRTMLRERGVRDPEVIRWELRLLELKKL